MRSSCAAQQTRRSQNDHPVEQGEEDDGGGPFLPGSSQTHQQCLRNKRRRVRSRDERTAGHSDCTIDDTNGNANGGMYNHGQAKRTQQSQSSRLLVGKKLTDGTELVGSKPSAAKTISCVFCIDNVTIDATVGDLSRYVRDMGVNVVICYKVKPRRSPWQRQFGITPTDRSSFVCVWLERMLINC